MGAEHPDRLARLNQQGLVVAQLAQRSHDRVEGIPGARGAPGAPIDDQLVGVLGDLRVEVVHQHPQGRLLLPAPAGDLGAAWRTDLTRAAHRSSPIAPSIARRSSPLAISRSAASSSGASWRSGPGPAMPAALIAAIAALGARRRRQRGAQLEPAGGADGLDRENAPQVLDRPSQLAGGPPAHRDVVLLHRAGRQRVHPRRGGEQAILGDHRRLRVLGDHQPRIDARVLGEEGRQTLRPACVEQAVRPPLGDRAGVGDRHREQVAGERRGVPRGSCRMTRPVRRAGPSGCRSPSAAPALRRRRRGRARHGRRR